MLVAQPHRTKMIAVKILTPIQSHILAAAFSGRKCKGSLSWIVDFSFLGIEIMERVTHSL